MTEKTEKRCSVDGCENPCSAKGLCRKHYTAQWYQANAIKQRELAIVRGKEWRKQNPDRERERHHAWYKLNKEKVLAAKTRWRLLNPDKEKEQRKRAYRKDPEASKQRSMKWVSEHPERTQELHRQWSKANKQRLAELTTQWRKANYARHMANHHRYRARKKNADGKYTASEWKELCDRYGNICLACGLPKKLTVDHVIPLSMGGTNSIDNLQPLCHSCNSAKNDKTTDYRQPASYGTTRASLLTR